MEKLKRSYYLPGKLLDVFDKDAGKGGFVREKVVAAAILQFLNSNPAQRAKMFERLDGFVSSKKK